MAMLPNTTQPGTNYCGTRKTYDAGDANGNRIHQNEIADYSTEQHDAEAPSAEQAQQANYHVQHSTLPLTPNV
ncbi:hypothetical protein [Steroidobacter cummioxidans]|uniref:hypothetical protein n=1 Tax=Steroidobacter cummioxidans TaxID=1803913 RepID=UPI00128FE837|nr:hypothetical protein [Steroidobacter cummioxidans]